MHPLGTGPKGLDTDFFPGSRSAAVDCGTSGVMDPLLTQSYHFDLPQELIAAEPLDSRDESRLLVVRTKTRTWTHSRVRDLPTLLGSNTVIVANNTRVFPARLIGERLETGGKVEFFLLHRLSQLRWEGLMKAGGKVLPGYAFRIPKPEGGWLVGRVISRKDEEGGALFTADFSEDPLTSGAGEVPLPPYIVQQRVSLGLPPLRKDELEIYNTSFSKESGSVAAPTAGRHFTPGLISELRAKGIDWEEITLHVGIGTFRPVGVENLRDHRMHPEWTEIRPDTAARLEAARRNGKKILVVGTTTARTLEGRAESGPDGPHLRPGAGEVNLFIHPGASFAWRWTDQLLTNFHLPGSSLLMMIASRIGDLGFTLEIYQEAIRNRYRFYSYGDAMLIMDE
jgi:S-adenosylmethionine:tRNA ribosyltransferase-isomerase